MSARSTTEPSVEDEALRCDHERGCEDCTLQSRDLNAAGELARDWSGAIGFLVDRAKEDGDATGRVSPTYLTAIDGLAYAIGMVAELDILNETRSHRREPKALESVRRAS